MWWSCDQCPDSLPHVWEAAVYSRSHRTGCPYCSGNAVCQHNTRARKAPQVAQLWNAKKNHPLSPDQVTVSSGRRAHWKCSDCLHEWQAPVVLKARNNTGCPKCAKANGGRKADGPRQKHPTFAAAKHALLEQWDYVKNRIRSFPDNASLQSNKPIWWHCHACSKGQIHSWQTRPCHRTSGKVASGYPFCAGHKVCECNYLETVDPNVAADFDIEQNGVTAAEVTSSTQSTAGCQMSLKPKRTWQTKRKSSQLLGASD